MRSVVNVPAASVAAQRVLDVRHTEDFIVTGRGDNSAWAKVEPIPVMPYQDAAVAEEHATWFKALWSPTGVYFLIDCADRKLAATFLSDMADLWTQDVAEVFIWPDESTPLYLEYEISPFASELVLMVNNQDNEYSLWLPFHYAGPRRTRKAVAVRGGPAKPSADITGWSAEIFIPSALLHPLRNAQPQVGTTWCERLSDRLRFATSRPVRLPERGTQLPQSQGFRDAPVRIIGPVMSSPPTVALSGDLADHLAMMRYALALARQAAVMGEVPVGAVIFQGGKLLAQAFNRRETDHDPTAHAEMLVLREAARALGSWRLDGCTLAVTLEPCPMCAGALVNARLPRLVYGAADPKMGSVETLYQLCTDKRLNHRIEVTGGVMSQECGDVLREFFRQRREKPSDL